MLPYCVFVLSSPSNRVYDFNGRAVKPTEVSTTPVYIHSADSIGYAIPGSTQEEDLPPSPMDPFLQTQNYGRTMIQGVWMGVLLNLDLFVSLLVWCCHCPPALSHFAVETTVQPPSLSAHNSTYSYREDHLPENGLVHLPSYSLDNTDLLVCRDCLILENSGEKQTSQ